MTNLARPRGASEPDYCLHYNNARFGLPTFCLIQREDGAIVIGSGSGQRQQLCIAPTIEAAFAFLLDLNGAENERRLQEEERHRKERLPAINLSDLNIPSIDISDL